MARLPIAPFEKILKEKGNNIRVSEPAARSFAAVIEEIALEMAEECADLARHAGRRTVMDSDVLMVSKKKKF